MPGGIARQEKRLAYAMLLPTFVIVLAIVLLPVGATFWISTKPVGLADLRAPTPVVSERVRSRTDVEGADGTIEYRLRNSSATQVIEGVTLTDRLPPGIRLFEVDPRCRIDGDTFFCDLGTLDGGFRDRIRIAYAGASEEAIEGSSPVMTGDADNILTNLTFTFDNYTRIFQQREFWDVIRVTIVYTIFGTIGSMALGLFAALLMNQKFRGRAFFRGLFLFPYVAPVIAVAFTWIILLDPFSGTLNALGVEFGFISAPINFLGVRDVPISIFGFIIEFPVALSTVIAFEAWRYFPLAFLFILARLQSLSADLEDAAKVDGATPFQLFRYIIVPQLVGVIAVLFMLRFIWTFNKFDDIFLLTGGAAGTRTLTVDVYEQGFALADLGAGAAVSVVIFVLLLIFVVLYMRVATKEEGL